MSFSTQTSVAQCDQKGRKSVAERNNFAFRTSSTGGGWTFNLMCIIINWNKMMILGTSKQMIAVTTILKTMMTKICWGLILLVLSSWMCKSCQEIHTSHNHLKAVRHPISNTLQKLNCSCVNHSTNSFSEEKDQFSLTDFGTGKRNSYYIMFKIVTRMERSYSAISNIKNPSIGQKHL